VETSLLAASLLGDVATLLENFAEGVLVGLAVLVATALVYALVRVSLGLVAIAIVRVHRSASNWLAARRTAATYITDGRPSYSLTLLVRLDQRSGRLAPSVQLRGQGKLVKPWIRLELVDASGRLRHLARKRARRAIGAELALPPFMPPDGVAAAEALGWHWDVVIEDEQGERARWREHPRPVAYLNAEAELA
jgi:hypothetical protein